jgi:hypothetical protein
MLNPEARELFDRTRARVDDAIDRDDRGEASSRLQILLQVAGGERDCHAEVRDAVDRFRSAFSDDDPEPIDFPTHPGSDASTDDLDQYRSEVVLLFPDDPREDVLDGYLNASAIVDRRRRAQKKKESESHPHERRRAQQPRGRRSTGPNGIPTWALLAGAAVVIGGVALWVILRR